LKMTYFEKPDHSYHRVIFEFTDKEMKTAGFEKFNFMPNRLEILSVLQRINSNDLKKSGPPETLEAHLSHLEETIKRFSREDYADLQRKKDGWKAKALRLIGFLNDKDKEIERKNEYLEYYANEENYKETKEWTHDHCYPGNPPVLDDKGQIAREGIKDRS